MILAITGRIENITKKRPFNKQYYLTKEYKDIFDQLNILLFPVISEKNLDKVCDICDGLIVTGSCIDINPKYYNEKPIKGNDYNVDEFKLDKKIIELFVNEGKPILGICGGLQSINVAFGGSLNQNIDNHKLGNLTHEIKIANQSFLNKVYNCDSIFVNSYHHQSIKDIAPNFNITSVSNDGTIESIEKGNIVGVQWHPEKLNDIIFFEKFVRYFID